MTQGITDWRALSPHFPKNGMEDVSALSFLPRGLLDGLVGEIAERIVFGVRTDPVGQMRQRHFHLRSFLQLRSVHRLIHEMPVNVLWLQTDDAQPHVLGLSVLALKRGLHDEAVVVRLAPLEDGDEFRPALPRLGNGFFDQLAIRYTEDRCFDLLAQRIERRIAAEQRLQLLGPQIEEIVLRAYDGRRLIICERGDRLADHAITFLGIDLGDLHQVDGEPGAMLADDLRKAQVRHGFRSVLHVVEIRLIEVVNHEHGKTRLLDHDHENGVLSDHKTIGVVWWIALATVNFAPPGI